MAAMATNGKFRLKSKEGKDPGRGGGYSDMFIHKNIKKCVFVSMITPF